MLLCFFNSEVYLQIHGTVKQIKTQSSTAAPSACDMWALILGVTLDHNWDFGHNTLEARQCTHPS